MGDAFLKRAKDPKAPKINNKKSPDNFYPLDAEDHQMGDYKVAEWAITE